MSNRPLPTGEAALELALAHLFVSAPMRLERPRPTEYGMPPFRAAIAGVSIDERGWLFAWVAYLPTGASAPTLSVWPTVQIGARFDAVLPAAAEVEVIARVDTPQRAVARLARHLDMLVRAKLNPDLDYLQRAVGAYRAELRARRDREDAARRADTQQPPPA